MRVFVFLALALIVATLNGAPSRVGGGVAVAASMDQTFNVTNFGFSSYRIDGVDNPTLTLVRGQTYTFNVSAIGHPFYIKTARVTGTGSRYDSGVTGQAVTSGTLTFVVPGDAPNQLFYQCGVHPSMGGTLDIISPTDVSGRGAGVVWLAPARPNPARDGALFQFGLPRETRIDFIVFDSRGRRIRTLSNGSLPAGVHFVSWNGRDDAGRLVPSGSYFYRFRAEGRQLGGRLTLRR